MARTNRAKHVISAFDMSANNGEAVAVANLRPFFVTVTHYSDEWECSMDHILHPSRASIGRLAALTSRLMNPMLAGDYPTPIFPLLQMYDAGASISFDHINMRLTVDREKSKLFPIS